MKNLNRLRHATSDAYRLQRRGVDVKGEEGLLNKLVMMARLLLGDGAHVKQDGRHA